MGNVRGAGRKILIARPAASRGRGKVKRYRYGSSCNYGLFWFASRKRQVGDSRPRPLASSESDVSGTSITSRPIEIYPAVTLPSSSSLSFPTHTLPIESNTQHPFLSQNTASPQPIVNIPSDKEYTLISFLHQGFLIAQVVCVRPNIVTITNGIAKYYICFLINVQSEPKFEAHDKNKSLPMFTQRTHPLLDHIALVHWYIASVN